MGSGTVSMLRRPRLAEDGPTRRATDHPVDRLEAYGVVAATLLRHEGAELDERQFLADCLALGRQYQLQQRIHSPESLAKPLFSNALQLAVSRGLVGPSRHEARREFLEEVHSASATSTSSSRSPRTGSSA